MIEQHIGNPSELAMWYITKLGGVDKHTLALNAGCPQNDNLRVSNDGQFVIVQPMVEEPCSIESFIEHLNKHAEVSLEFDTTDSIRDFLKDNASGWEELKGEVSSD